MAEPSSSAAAGGYAVYKLAVAFGLPAGLVTLVVMLWVQPQSKREWAMALVSTVVSSICGGAAVVQYYGLASWGDTYIGLMAMAGIIFACGLPGWVIVRSMFVWSEKRKAKDLGEIIKDVRQAVEGA